MANDLDLINWNFPDDLAENRDGFEEALIIPGGGDGRPLSERLKDFPVFIPTKSAARNKEAIEEMLDKAAGRPCYVLADEDFDCKKIENLNLEYDVDLTFLGAGRHIRLASNAYLFGSAMSTFRTF